MKQQITGLTSEMKLRIESQRKWVCNHYSIKKRDNYNSVNGKLKLLNTILKSNWINMVDTVKLQSLGITLGDILVQEFDFKWIQIQDEYGIDPALKLENTTIILFPLTMISKRIENGETVDIYKLYSNIKDKVKELIRKGY